MSHKCLIRLCMLNSLMLLLLAVSLGHERSIKISESVFDQSVRFTLEGTFSAVISILVQSQWACRLFWLTWPFDIK